MSVPLLILLVSTLGLDGLGGWHWDGSDGWHLELEWCGGSDLCDNKAARRADVCKSLDAVAFVEQCKQSGAPADGIEIATSKAVQAEVLGGEL